MEQLACLAATQVIAVGQSLRDRAIDGKLVSARKITVLGGGSPNGVDVDRLARAARNERAMRCLRAELGIADDDIIVTFVGRVTADKGIESLARAMADLEVDSKFRLLVVGGIDDESGRRGESKLRAVLPRVSFVGEVADVAPYLAISNVFCLPSRREGLPTVVLEAFAAGIPVVATAATGIIDLVANGETGRLVAIDSPTALAEALREAVRDIDGSETMALAAYRLVKERYAQEVVQLRWIEAIKRNVERQSGKSDRAHRPTRFSPADAAFRSGESRRRRA
jgi:glycosyltransferase involved in cell wall biosynthesis